MPNPPIDMYFSKGDNDTGDSNIRTNKGTGIAFCALDKTEKDQYGRPIPYWLVKFKRKDPVTDENITWEQLKDYHADTENDENRTYDPERDYYDFDTYNTAFYTADGMLLEDCELKVDTAGYLYFKFIDDEGEEHVTDNFAVIADGRVRPGDDFRLRFGIEEAIVSPLAVANEGDFLACYDKKMLWRANLYIDSGENDWNNDNPWIGTVEHPNEWEEESADKPGGQIPLQPWTQPGGDFYYWIDIDNGEIGSWPIAETKVYDSIAYSNAGDEVKEFNDKMAAQAENLPTIPPNNWTDYLTTLCVPSYRFYNSTQVKTNYTIYGRITKNRFDNEIIGKYNDTNDPYQEIRNFIKSMYKELNGIKYLKNLIPDDDQQESISSDDRLVLEGYLRQINYTSEDGKSVSITLKDENLVSHNAGIVCDQFVNHSRSYENNKYKNGVGFNNNWLFDGGSRNINNSRYGLTGDMRYLVPGDIVYYNASIGPPIHVGFVWYIKYEEDGEGDREPIPEEVKIIHATTWDSQWKVQNSQSIVRLLRIQPYILLRLIE